MTSIIATIIGYMGTVCLIASFQFKKEKTLYLIQILSGVFFTVHYLMLQNYMGMTMNLVGLARVGMMYSQNPKLTGKTAKYGLIAAIIFLSILSWEDRFSIFPMLALVVTTFFVFSGDGVKMRYAQMGCAAPSWIIYNLHVGSVPGIVTETIDIFSILFYFARTALQNRHPHHAPLKSAS